MHQKPIEMEGGSSLFKDTQAALHKGIPPHGSLLLDSSSWWHVLTPVRSAMKRSRCRPFAVRWATTGRAPSLAAARERERQTQARHFISITAVLLDLHLSFCLSASCIAVSASPFSSRVSSCFLLPFPSIFHPLNLDETD